MKRNKSIHHQIAIVGLSAIFTAAASFALEPDYIGPPAADDPSAYTGPIVSEERSEALVDAVPAMEGALEIQNGQHADIGINNGVFTGTMSEGAGGNYDVPTGGAASPMFGALPFTQPFLRFEEFGPQKLDPAEAASAERGTFPLPLNAASGPDSDALDSFLAQRGIYPFPSEFSNTIDINPWTSAIEDFLERALDHAPMEGRAGGQGWAHQRWNEFYPQAYVKTGQSGARENGGFRNELQLHTYSKGEFGPGGLYHLAGGTKGVEPRFHPDLPLQLPETLWTWDGTFPLKLMMARIGEPVIFRHYNALPIDPTANRGFGIHTVSTHEHNGHNPAESDGFANAFFFPGQYYDYRWPMQIAGYDTINTTAEDPKASYPCAEGETLFVNDLNPGVKACANGRINVRGDQREIMSTHWFHDHMFDFTAPNVYKGDAAMMNYYSGKDRGNESIHDGANLAFPSGDALSWGNRDYDVNIVLADKAFDDEGQLWFNIFNLDGFIGDVLTVNYLYHPVLEVRARSYRFRILDGSVSRYFKLALVQEVAGRTTGEIQGAPGQDVSWNRVPFHMIANDGNILEHAIAFDGKTDLDGDGDRLEHKGTLPQLGIAERYDIIVDFSKHNLGAGAKLFFVNLLEHRNGKIVEGNVPLEQVLREEYKAVIVVTDGVASWTEGDPVVGKFMQLDVVAYDGTDLSMNPADFEPGKERMTEMPWDRNNAEDVAAIKDARRRTFHFGRSSGTDVAPWTIKTDDGGGLTADMRRVSAAPQLAQGPTEAGFSGDGTREVWKLTTGGGWSHPIHIHFEEGVIISKDGQLPPMWEIGARKDVFRLGNEEDAAREIEIAYHFREFAGSFVEHCHNTQHEDHAMLLRWDLEHPGQVQVMPSVIPTWDGVEYIDSIALPTFREGRGVGPSDGIPTNGATTNVFLAAVDVQTAVDAAAEAADAAAADVQAAEAEAEAEAAANEAAAAEIAANEANAEAAAAAEAEADAAEAEAADAAAAEVAAAAEAEAAADAAEAAADAAEAAAEVADAEAAAEVAAADAEVAAAAEAEAAADAAAADAAEAAAEVADAEAAAAAEAEAAADAAEAAAEVAAADAAAAQAVAAPQQPTVVMVRAKNVDERGRIKIEGSVAAGLQVSADLAGITCRTRDSGKFKCEGRDLPAGHLVTFTAQ